ncbi:hypothetical protein [Ideonella livida]|uniref:Phage tail collar domain-containing protein n=1 Tax=Ideonella livida TaxID=2707176 RepID=A0A7C9PEL1_9BURK|nr:hypothetical protein [Ideonella livida]NDY89729.1 hypothetical protein [Ideonella livida]
MALPVTPILTTVGKAAASAAYAAGESISVTHVVLGKAAGYVPAQSQTSLVQPVEVCQITYGASTGSSATLTALASGFAGAQYQATEVGFYIGGAPSAGGVLFAVYSAPGWVCAHRGGADVDLASSWTLDLSEVPAGSVTVTVDPSSGYDASVMHAHTEHADPHGQYVRHDAPQSLSDVSQAQARANVAAEKAGTMALAMAAHAESPGHDGLYLRHDAMQSLDVTARSRARANINAADDAEVVKRDGSVAMLGALQLPGNASAALHAVPKQQLEAYVASQLSSLPGDKYLQGLASYNQWSNVLTLAMNDGTTVDVDMTELLADAASTAIGQHTGETAHLSVSQVQDMINASVAAAVRACRPVGQVFGHYGESAPAGSVEIAGQLLARDGQYGELWGHAQAAGKVVSDAVWLAGGGSHTMFSSGDGWSTFRMPRFGGEFARFADRGAGVEPGRGIGAWVGDKLRLHGHPYIAGTGNGDTDPDGGIATEGNGTVSVHPAYTGAPENNSGQAKLIGGTGENETAPRSVGLLACMWY